MSKISSILIVVVVLSILIYLSYHKKKEQIDYDSLIKKIELKNDSLLKQIELDKIEIGKIEKRFDSLEQVKNKIIVKYKEKENEIDKGSSAYLVNEFKDIFASGGIK